MRGADTFTEGLFTLKRLGGLFAQRCEDYGKGGHPSIAPGKRQPAVLPQVL